ncbi:MAG: alpha/beta hydrolase [Oscillospiraceae bacterium]|nr:alpha/beta hydrolase [Oscillospiraceae bacterium]
MEIVKKIFKAAGRIFLGIMIILLLALVGLFIYHRIHTSKNKEFLKEMGYYNPVSVGDHSLNLVEYDGAKDKHRIVALGGNGWGFPLELRELADELREEGAVYYPARAGYDGSDDVKQDMTVEFVVEDYRKVLRNAGVEAPYILMPHSYAGVLATYWVNKYPDEIEAMIDLDGIIAQSFTEEQLQEAMEQTKGMATIRGVMNLGIGDVALHVFFPKDPDYSEDEQHIYDAMTLMTSGSAAFVSDIGCVAVNTDKTWKIMQPNDVPKLYISSSNGYRTVEELEADDVLSEYRIAALTEGFEGSDEERRAKAYEMEFAEISEYRKEKMQPYIEKLGNCELVDLPGSHFIHLEKPHECAEIIKDFIGGLN